MNPTAIRLSPLDNVAVCCRPIEAGERILVEERELVIDVAVPIGHKVAFVDLKKGDKVRKYGMPIGSVTVDAPAGSWVHLHNMKSDYLPAHMRDAAGDQA
ncbi:UxaA family hydrolase [Sphingobium sp. Sx8-8]|uniref:UxaA family hydrolase n=1 Tax=Sphingobium sp. Sx8-8 TaxID=2933617 RepID=UPI001F5A7AA2|nr:UxaA family hydrolase [Sphingobium sp. Sx8-8]